MIAIGKYLRIKYKKASIVAGMLRGKKADEALKLLRFIPKKASGLIYKVLKSAIHNAENNFKKDRDNLIVSEVIVNKGPELKRIRPVSRGRAHKITKGVSHVTVKLAESASKVDKAVKAVEKKVDSNTKVNKK